METTPNTGSLGQGASESEAPPAAPPYTLAADNLMDVSWLNTCLGIVIAGGLYPFSVVATLCVLGVLTAAWQILFDGRIPMDVGELVAAAFSLGIAAVGGGVIGVLYSGFVTVFTIPFVYLFVRTMKVRATMLLFGAVWGGLVGFICVLLLTFNLADRITQADNFFADVFLPLTLGPGLATILGQIGGAWGGVRDQRNSETEYNRAKAWAAADRWQASTGAIEERGFDVSSSQPAVEIQNPKPAAQRPRLQFSVRHLLWITVWLSLLFSIMRLSGIAMEYMLPLLLGWMVYQSVTLYLGWRILRRWSARPAKPEIALAGRML